MTLDFEARSRAWLRRSFPDRSATLNARLAPRWQALKHDRAFQQTQSFLDNLPDDGWSFSIVDGALCFEHPNVDALPDTAVQALQDLRPWRKGPWSFASTRVDAEWRSELKWDRIVELLPPLEQQHVIDVGSNNGYYAQRLLEHGAASVLALDPQHIYVAQALCAEGLLPERPVLTVPDGLDLLEDLPRSASLILLMGILYHHSDPLHVLRLCANALLTNGRVLIETIIIPGASSEAIFVPKRYAGAKGFYWLPTESCLRAWIQRANLRIVEELPAVPTSAVEQRSTDWRFGDSLPEGLDPNDPSRTIEGHPAPQRIAFLCARG